MKHETIDYCRHRLAAERQAAATAACEAARWAHERMADAYARRIEIEELEAEGALPPGKVIMVADAVSARADAVLGRRAPSGHSERLAPTQWQAAAKPEKSTG